MNGSQGNIILRPKTKGRRSVPVKPRKRRVIESVVERILPTMWTGPIAEYGLPSINGGMLGNHAKQSDKNILGIKTDRER